MPMNLERNQEILRDLKDVVNQESDRLTRMLASGAELSECEKQEKALKAARQRYDMQAQICSDQEEKQTGRQEMRPVEDKPENKSLKEMLASKEYARSFRAALKLGAKADRSTPYHDSLKPVYDALTIAGGDPEGANGGFLVPEDVDLQIRKLMREMQPLSDLITVESVNTNSGSRVVDVAPTKGFTKIDGELKPVPEDDQPQFAQKTFTLDKYGLILPISNELVDDEASNLFGYLAGWFAEKLMITDNQLVLAELKKLSATAAANGAFGGLKSALNKGLTPIHSRNAVILTNQTGLDLLDQELDGNDHPLLQPDVREATGYRVLGRRLVVVEDAVLPNVSGGAPLYAGNLKQLATLYRRYPLRIASTTVGGNAWKNDGYEMRAIVRMGISTWDQSSTKALTLPTA